jgi:ATP-dependent helicase HrpB
MPDPPDLPVLALEGQIVEHLRHDTGLVLSAPTGSGKTTQVPQMLLAAGWGKVLVLQPRRLAARLVAERVAAERGEKVGETVGYATRFASRHGGTTRLLFCTEGVFLRMAHDDPGLDGIGAVVLDEFHERSLLADVALGLVRRLQRGRRPDLRLLVMSATLDAVAVAGNLGCPALESAGRTFPIETTYRPRPREQPVWQAAAQALGHVLQHHKDGDVLVFMPGAYEIRRTVAACGGLGGDLDVLPLYSALSAAQQDAAVATGGARRKVVVATNVAETSITIPGVRHVIDAGLARMARYDPRRGLNALLVGPISCAAADQRAGRAGRTAPGTCIRLWSQDEQHRRPQREPPQIGRLELSETLLQLRALGVDDLDAFPWLDAPPPDAVAGAESLLRGLGALDVAGKLSQTGRDMALMPLHPRLSRLLIEAARRGCPEQGALWAALLSESDIVQRPPQAEYTRPAAGGRASDLAVREVAWRRLRRGRFETSACQRAGLNADACRRVDQARALCLRVLQRTGAESSDRARTADGTDQLLKSVLVAYYDRVALRPDCEKPHCLMAGQRRVELDRHSAAGTASALVALEARETEAGRDGVRTVVSLASEIDTEWLLELFPERIAEELETRWNETDKAVEQHETMALDGLVFYRRQRRTQPEAAAVVLVRQIVQGQVRLEGWDEGVEQWLARSRFVARLFPERGLTAYDDEDVEVILHEIVAGATRASHLRRRPCLPAVVQALSWDDQQFVEKMAPTRIKLPSGHGMRLRYRDDGSPVGRAKIQDFYGLEETPKVAGGRQQVLLEILAPNFRPVQVTDDLRGFWQRTYPEVKKELKRRYPKHRWR